MSEEQDERGKVDSNETVTIELPLDVAERFVDFVQEGDYSIAVEVRTALQEALEARHPKWTWKRDKDGEGVPYHTFNFGETWCDFDGITDAQADAIVAVLNGGTQEPVADECEQYRHNLAVADQAIKAVEAERDALKAEVERLQRRKSELEGHAQEMRFDRDRYKALVDNQEVLAEGVVYCEGSWEDGSEETYVPVPSKYRGRKVRVVAVKDETTP